jgi:hypothetical protein
VFVLLLVIPAMRRATGEAAVLYIWTVSPRQKTSLFFFSIYEVHTRSVGRLQNCLFTFFYSISQRRIVMATNNYFVWEVGGGDFDTEKRKSGTISHATGPIWVVLLTTDAVILIFVS